MTITSPLELSVSNRGALNVSRVSDRSALIIMIYYAIRQPKRSNTCNQYTAGLYIVVLKYTETQKHLMKFWLLCIANVCNKWLSFHFYVVHVWVLLHCTDYVISGFNSHSSAAEQPAVEHLFSASLHLRLQLMLAHKCRPCIADETIDKLMFVRPLFKLKNNLTDWKGNCFAGAWLIKDCLRYKCFCEF